MSEAMLKLIKSRRVVRNLTDQPVEQAQIVQILEAARWAPCGGNMRVHRFVVVEDPETLRLIRMVSPGMFQQPPVLILICIDWEQVAYHEIPEHDPVLYVDVGTAMENMMLAAHAISLGSGPVTSFSKEAIRVVLNLPPRLTPELFVCIGHPSPKAGRPQRSRQKITWREMTDWERFEN